MSVPLRFNKPDQPNWWSHLGEKVDNVRRMEVTPDLAEQWLAERNVRNRRVSTNNVLKIITDLQQGRWRLNGETIIFGKDGNLHNGQHRLRAIAKSGVSAWSLVVFEIPDDAFETMDQGKIRTAPDVLSVTIKEHAQEIALSARWVIGIIDAARKGSRTISHKAPTVPQTLQVAKENPGLAYSVKLINVTKSNGVVIFSRSAAIAFHYIAVTSDRKLGQKTADFFHALYAGEGPASEEVNDLRNALIRHKKGFKQFHPRQLTIIIVKALNAYISGNRISSRIAVGESELVPRIKGFDYDSIAIH